MQELKQIGKEPTRKGFAEALVELGEKLDNVVVLGTDVTGSVMTHLFRDRFPDRFISLGVAEQNATTVAAGLALSGKIPFFASYSAFAAFRNADQLRISVSYNNANVKIGGAHSGITTGPDGATHQALEEIGFLRTLPNMTLVVPCDYMQTKKATIAIAEMVGPAYIRFGRASLPSYTTESTPFELGKADVYHEGDDVAIIACGIMVWESLIAARKLKEEKGINARVINCHTIKPIDVKTITDAARDCGCIVTAEEHQVHAGLGGAVSEVVGKNFPVPIEIVGMRDIYGVSGGTEELMEAFHMTWKEVYASALKSLDRKVNGSKGYREIKDVSDYQENL